MLSTSDPIHEHALWMQPALSWTPARERERIQGWLAWAHEIASIAHRVQDPSVVQAKLAWWTAELEHALAQQAQHPLMQRLSDGSPPRGELTLGQACIEGWAQDARQSRHLDEASLLSHARATGGQMAAFCVGWVAAPNEALQRYALAAGTALRLAAMTRRVGLDATRGRLYIPVSDLQQHDVKAHEILTRQSTLIGSDRYQALMRHQHRRALEHLEAARERMPAHLPASCSLLPIWMDLEARRLELVAEHRYAVLQQHLGLTPLQVRWYAARARWRWRHALRPS